MQEKIFKASIVDLNNGDFREFQYNPNMLRDDRFVVLSNSTVPGLATPRYQFVAGGDTVITFSLFLNALNHKDGGSGILKDIIWLRSRTFPIRSDNALKVAPAKIMLVWPGLYNTKGILSSCNLEYTAFFPDGKPKHCNIAVEIRKEY